MRRYGVIQCDPLVLAGLDRTVSSHLFLFPHLFCIMFIGGPFQPAKEILVNWMRMNVGMLNHSQTPSNRFKCIALEIFLLAIILC